MDNEDLLAKYKDLDAQLDHIDSLIERGISDDYDKHYDLLRRIDEVWAKLQVAEREELDPFGPADGQDNQDYDNLDYENDNMMYEQLRRGEG